MYQNPFYCYGRLFYFNKIMLFHFIENIHDLCLHLNIMHVCLLFYIVDDLVCIVRLTYMIRLASRCIRNQQNLYPKVSTAVVELLQYSGLGSNTGMGFLRERRVAMD